MMNYNFDELINRKHTNSYKWDAESDETILPMWVADMDFRTAQPIIDALTKRVQHGIYGYAKVPNEFYQATIHWFSSRHNFSFKKEWMLYTSGVVPAVSAIIKALTVPSDKVIIQAPVYNCFYSSIRNNGCEIVSNNLINDNGFYTIDFEDLELKLQDDKVKIFLLCNPHNPVGRVWTKEELIKIGDLCAKYNVKVVSDEIHCDLVLTDTTHVPFASINNEFLENSITCVAPSKTFNLAGLQVANIIVKDQAIKQKIDKALNINEVCDISPFAIEALVAAYTQGTEWLEQLKVYLKANYDRLKAFFETNLPQFKVTKLQATYLAWIDCSVLGIPSDDLESILLEEQHLLISSGTLYGEHGEGFIRLNMACPRVRLEEGLLKLQNSLIKLLNENGKRG